MLTLHPLLGDDAIIQCEKPIRFFGTAEVGATVIVHFSGMRREAVALHDGGWQTEFPAMPAGGPFELQVFSHEKTLLRSGLMLGEVWVCSGQSNMEWTLGMLGQFEAEIVAADDALLRVFTVARVPRAQPADRCEGIWRSTKPACARDFSAVAYFFAWRLRKETGRAIGVVVSAFGGTPIAAWMPRETLNAREIFHPLLRQNAHLDPELFIPHDFHRVPVDTMPWAGCEVDDSTWSELILPGYWQDQGWKHNGAVWLRRKVDLPESWRGRELILEIGACDDFDDTFVNGVRVGGLGPEIQNAYGTFRKYQVASTLTQQESVVIAIRVFDQWGNGGVTGGVWLRSLERSEDVIALSGPWKARVELSLPWRAPTGQIPATMLYNGMIRPLANAAVRGVLWYQGESDVARAELYRSLLPDLIAAWRILWRDPLLPFGIVQLANYKARLPEPAESDWAELRDAQLFASQSVAASGLIVTIDAGEAGDIHPKNKRVVGERLALWTLNSVYGQSTAVGSGPLNEAHRVEGDSIYITFSNIGAGLRLVDSSEGYGFQIAGETGRWTWASAEIVSPDVVRVWSTSTPAPRALRYAWQSNPPCVLYNSAGLPASPFSVTIE